MTRRELLQKRIPYSLEGMAMFTYYPISDSEIVAVSSNGHIYGPLKLNDQCLNEEDDDIIGSEYNGYSANIFLPDSVMGTINVNNASCTCPESNFRFPQVIGCQCGAMKG